MIELRRVEKRVGETFVPIEFDSIRKGDQVRIYDPGANPVEDGSAIYTAGSDAMLQPDGNSWFGVVERGFQLGDGA